MKDLLYGCTSLKELDLSNFNTENVTDMSYMFYNCSSLKKLNISNFNINKVKVINYMFYECSSLEYLIFPESTINIYNILKKDAEGFCDKCPKLMTKSIEEYISISPSGFFARKTGMIKNLKIFII